MEKKEAAQGEHPVSAVSEETRSTTHHLNGLQQVRAFAALLVLLYHASAVFGQESYFPGVASSEQIFSFGHSGVELFFVLSGLIIAHAHFDDQNTRAALKRYVGNRIARIYPPVIIAVTAFIAIKVYGGISTSLDGIITSYTLLPISWGYAPPALWTLTHEVLFYVLFMTSFYSKRAFVVLLILWGLIGTLIYFGKFFDGTSALFDALITPYNALFLIGFIAYFVGRRHKITGLSAIITFWSGVVLFCITAASDVHLNNIRGSMAPEQMRTFGRVLTLCYGAASGAMLLGVYSGGLAFGGLAGRALCYLGDASFSIYLWHETVQRILARVLFRFHLQTVPYRFSAMILLVLLGGVVGCLIWSFVDRPITRALRKRIRSNA